MIFNPSFNMYHLFVLSFIHCFLNDSEKSLSNVDANIFFANILDGFFISIT